jgi:hypothetical protein
MYRYTNGTDLSAVHGRQKNKKEESSFLQRSSLVIQFRNLRKIFSALVYKMVPPFDIFCAWTRNCCKPTRILTMKYEFDEKSRNAFKYGQISFSMLRIGSHIKYNLNTGNSLDTVILSFEMPDRVVWEILRNGSKEHAGKFLRNRSKSIKSYCTAPYPRRLIFTVEACPWQWLFAV